MLRNLDRPLTTDRPLIGRPRELYVETLSLLEDVAEGREAADAVLTDTVRVLLRVRNDREARLRSLQADLRGAADCLQLSVEQIVTLLSQHLAYRNSSRLPVLIVAAAYDAAADKLGEARRSLYGHNAADLQTGAYGDVEVTLVGEDQVRTVYEMKTRPITRADIEVAITKVAASAARVDNYVFVTTRPPDVAVTEYAAGRYEATGGTEFAILDCIGFARHFLHLFHRRRIAFLDAYQALVLAEPDSSVGPVVKEALLNLRLGQAETEG